MKKNEMTVTIIDENHIHYEGSNYRKLMGPKRYYYASTPERRLQRMLYMRQYRDTKKQAVATPKSE